MTVSHRVSRGALVFAWCGAAAFALSLLYFFFSYLVRYGRSPGSVDAGPAVLTDIALFSAFALHHSLFARSPVKARLAARLGPALERSAYTWIASILFLLVCGLWRLVPGDAYVVSGPAAVVGYAVQALGMVITWRTSAKLDVLDLAGVRAAVQATRGERPDHVPLETRGPYAYVRHPLYLGWALVVFGTPRMTMTRLVFAIVSTAYLAIAIPFEERALVQTFGSRYRDYQRQVRWRMIPGIY